MLKRSGSHLFIIILFNILLIEWRSIAASGHLPPLAQRLADELRSLNKSKRALLDELSKAGF